MSSTIRYLHRGAALALTLALGAAAAACDAARETTVDVEPTWDAITPAYPDPVTSYEGGLLLSNPTVSVVHYGTPTDGASFWTTFYKNLITPPNSYIAWLSEYSVPALPQYPAGAFAIGTATYDTGSPYQVGPPAHAWRCDSLTVPGSGDPAAAPDKCGTATYCMNGDPDSTGLTDLQKNLLAKAAAGTIPHAGTLPDPNTIYAVHMSPNVCIVNWNSDKNKYTACSPGTAWHNGLANLTPLRLTAIQDVCGADQSNHTMAASHELMESITNPQNQAWRDHSSPSGDNEISDICGGTGGGTFTANGATYQVAAGWSNVNHTCWVGGSPACSPAVTELLTNGNFEAGGLGWTENSTTGEALAQITNTSTPAPPTPDNPTSAYNAVMCGTGHAGQQFLQAIVNLPAASTCHDVSLNFLMEIESDHTDGTAHDTFDIRLGNWGIPGVPPVGYVLHHRERGTPTLTDTWSNLDKSSAYQPWSIDLSSYLLSTPQQLLLLFVCTEDGTGKTTFLLDDVSVK